MGRFWRNFWPYQLWRFAVINTRMFAVAKGWIGPHHRTQSPTPAAKSSG